MLRNFFKTTIRNLWKNKTYSFLNIFGLAIGIACAGLIFLWAEDEKTFDDVNIKKANLYDIQINMGNMFTMGSTPRPLAGAIKSEIPGIVNTARVSDQGERLLFSFDNKSLYATGLYADPAIFSMFTLPFLEGNAKSAFAQLYSVVITQKAAKKFFGTSKDVIGKSVRIDNRQNWIVTGILKDPPENCTLQFEWLAPYQILTADEYARLGKNSDEFSWGSYGPFTYVELDGKRDLSSINDQLQEFIHRKDPKEKSTAFLFPMSDWRLYSEFANGKQTGGGRIKQVRMLVTIAWIILFIACINFMNLATANSQKRAREVGVRKVLGAAKGGLVIQFIGEALFMSFLAAMISVFMIILALPAFNMLMQKDLSLGLTNPSHITAMLIISVLCGLVAGSYPSLYLSSFNPASVLKGLKIKTGGAALIRKGLVILQFVVSVVFIISTIVVYMQIQHIKNRKLGFNKNNLIEINPQHDISKTFSLIKSELFQSGLFENAAIADHQTLYGGDTDNQFKWQGKLSDNEVSIAHRNVSPEYISTSGMHVIEGADFTPYVLDQPNVIINESMAKMMGNGSPVGKIIQSPRGDPEGVFKNATVIGVVGDYVYGNIYNGGASPLILFCKPPEYVTFLYVRTKAGADIEKALAKTESVMKKISPEYPFEYRFVDEQFNKMFQNETLISDVSTVFAILAVMISCLGLFGLATYTAEQRIKEIGIRKVLGASVTGLTALLSKDFLRLVGISCLIAFPIAWWIMYNWLQNYEYRITISIWVFLIAAVLAISIALLTVSFQAIKAAIANPVKSLRSE